jgi:hypothetical protein
MASDDGNAWNYWAVPGASGTIGNSQCTLNLAQSSVSASGNDLYVTLAVTLSQAYVAGSAKPIQAFVYDHASSGFGWTPVGTRTLTPVVPDFTISLVPVAAAVVAGGTVATYTVTIGAVNGFAGTVGFVPSGLPGGASATFSPPSINGSGATTMTVNTAVSGVTGTFSLIVTGISGTLRHPGSPVPLLVQDFTIALSPNSQTIANFGTATLTLSAGGVNGYNQPVSLFVTNTQGIMIVYPPGGLSPGVSANFSIKPTVSGGGYATVEIRAYSGGANHIATAYVLVASTGDFAILPATSSQTIAPPGTANYPLAVTAVNNFSGAVGNFSVSGLPSGASGGFSSQSVQGSGSTTLNVSAVAGTVTGTYPLTINGSNASAGTRSATVWLVVSSGPDFTLTTAQSSQTIAPAGRRGVLYSSELQRRVQSQDGGTTWTLVGVPSSTPSTVTDLSVETSYPLWTANAFDQRANWK